MSSPSIENILVPSNDLSNPPLESAKSNRSKGFWIAGGALFNAGCAVTATVATIAAVILFVPLAAPTLALIGTVGVLSLAISGSGVFLLTTTVALGLFIAAIKARSTTHEILSTQSNTEPPPQKISLQTFSKCSLDEQKKILEENSTIKEQIRYWLKNSMGQNKPTEEEIDAAYDDHLKNYPYEKIEASLLDDLTLLDLIPNYQVSSLPYAKMNDATFNALTYGHLKTMAQLFATLYKSVPLISPNQAAFITKRLAKQPVQQDLGPLTEDIDQTPLNRLKYLPFTD